jgi:hypothetical protein
VGKKIIRSPIDHIRAAQTGCCIGQAFMIEDGFGLPKSCLQADVTALTGFQLAIVCSHVGFIPWVDTTAFDTRAIGNRMTSPIPWAVSGFLVVSPKQAQPQDMA